jgi:hypothetical protein
MIKLGLDNITEKFDFTKIKRDYRYCNYHSYNFYSYSIWSC